MLSTSPDWTTLIPLSPGAQSLLAGAQEFLVAVVDKRRGVHLLEKVGVFTKIRVLFFGQKSVL